MGDNLKSSLSFRRDSLGVVAGPWMATIHISCRFVQREFCGCSIFGNIDRSFSSKANLTSRYGIQDTKFAYISTGKFGNYDELLCFSCYETPGTFLYDFRATQLIIYFVFSLTFSAVISNI